MTPSDVESRGWRERIGGNAGDGRQDDHDPRGHRLAGRVESKESVRWRSRRRSDSKGLDVSDQCADLPGLEGFVEAGHVFPSLFNPFG